MIKKNLKLLLVTSVIIIFPVFVGLFLWNSLPQQLPTHWGPGGQVDGWSSKPFAVLGLPGILLLVHWICMIAAGADPKHKNYTPKMLNMVLWICPVISLLCNAMVYGTALGYEINVQFIMPLLMGLMFLILGNMLPKCKQSYTLGIKLPWTLASEENWNKTHRMAGKLWVAGGLVIMATAFLGIFWIMIGVLFVLVLVPTAYSYLYYRRHEEEK